MKGVKGQILRPRELFQSGWVGEDPPEVGRLLSSYSSSRTLPGGVTTQVGYMG